MSNMLLAGRSILVVDDDFYLAEDARRALEKAGGTVLGPVNSDEDALALLGREEPDCALLDVNLGSGPNFVIAKALSARNIPWIFVTGYDENTIPPEFANAPRLLKPVEARHLVAAVAGLWKQNQ